MEGYEKVLLRGYAIVEKVIAGIDDLVERRALASFWSRESCESVAEKILALTETKGELLILREKLGKSLRALGKEDLELIAFRYWKIVPKREGFEHVSRNYFRKQKRALRRFSDELIRRGMTSDWFDEYCMRFGFIRSIAHSQEREKKEKEICSVKKTDAGNAFPDRAESMVRKTESAVFEKRRFPRKDKMENTGNNAV